jgi:bacterioferritin-associated ferredoxin
MYVCVCKAITDKQVIRAIDEGADNLMKLKTCLGLATQCGRCSKTARVMLREHSQESSSAGTGLRFLNWLPST